MEDVALIKGTNGDMENRLPDSEAHSRDARSLAVHQAALLPNVTFWLQVETQRRVCVGKYAQDQ
jgi:hypothetical protein